MPEPIDANPYQHQDPADAPCDIIDCNHGGLTDRGYWWCVTHKCTFTSASTPDACPCAKDKDKENG